MPAKITPFKKLVKEQPECSSVNLTQNHNYHTNRKIMTKFALQINYENISYRYPYSNCSGNRWITYVFSGLFNIRHHSVCKTKARKVCSPYCKA